MLLVLLGDTAWGEVGYHSGKGGEDASCRSSHPRMSYTSTHRGGDAVGVRRRTNRVVLMTQRDCRGGGKDREDGDALLRWCRASEKPVIITLMPEAAFLGISVWFV